MARVVREKKPEHSYSMEIQSVNIYWEHMCQALPKQCQRIITADINVEFFIC